MLLDTASDRTPKPNTLEFIELTMEFEGLEEPATLVTPFGYAKAINQAMKSRPEHAP